MPSPLEPARSYPDAIALCMNPNGLHEHVPVQRPRDEQTCFAICDCTPRVYVAVDALLSDRAIEAVRAADFGMVPRAEYERFLRAAVDAAKGESEA